MNDLVVRRSILNALQEAAPMALDMEELCAFFPQADREQVRREVGSLEAWGYVANAWNVASPCWKLTGEGLSQIRREARELDPKLWGKLAL